VSGPPLGPPDRAAAERLIAVIGALRQQEEPLVTWTEVVVNEDGSFQPAYPSYQRAVREVFRVINEDRWKATTYDPKADGDWIYSEEALAALDYEGVRRALTCLTRLERFGEGFWAMALERGAFERMAGRVGALLEEGVFDGARDAEMSSQEILSRVYAVLRDRRHPDTDPAGAERCCAALRALDRPEVDAALAEGLRVEGAGALVVEGRLRFASRRDQAYLALFALGRTGRLDDIRFLDLRGHRVFASPPELRRAAALVMLSLRETGLTEEALAAALPTLAALPALRRLNLRGNPLGALPPALRQLAGLELLSLSETGLTEEALAAALPTLAALPALRRLNLRSNQLTGLPAGVGALSGLTSLDLRGNQLTGLPAELGALSGLTSLDLAGNQLRFLPLELGQLRALKILNLSGNRLDDAAVAAIAPAIAALPALKLLALRDNPFTAWPEALARFVPRPLRRGR